MKHILLIAALTSFVSCAYADSISSRIFQSSAEQAKNYAIERTAGTAFDTAKGAVEHLAYSETIQGTAVRVLDGDTADIRANDKTIRVRFDSIDAPEKTQPFGQLAKRTLTTWIGNQPVTVKITGKDRYGRMIGVVMLEGVNVNKAMVQKGLAFANTQYLNDKSIQAVEDQAKKERAGVWQIPEDQIVKPWDYRHSIK